MCLSFVGPVKCFCASKWLELNLVKLIGSTFQFMVRVGCPYLRLKFSMEVTHDSIAKDMVKGTSEVIRQGVTHTTQTAIII
jgi:hypothetical protein